MYFFNYLIIVLLFDSLKDLSDLIYLKTSFNMMIDDKFSINYVIDDEYSMLCKLYSLCSFLLVFSI